MAPLGFWPIIVQEEASIFFEIFFERFETRFGKQMRFMLDQGPKSAFLSETKLRKV